MRSRERLLAILEGGGLAAARLAGLLASQPLPGLDPLIIRAALNAARDTRRPAGQGAGHD